MGIIDISSNIEPIVFVAMNKILKYFQPLFAFNWFYGMINNLNLTTFFLHITSRARSIFYLSDLDVSISLKIHHNFSATFFSYKKRNTHVL